MVMDAPLRFFTRTAVLATGLVLALLLNILTLTSELVFDALSKAVGAVSSLVTTKPVTVKARHAQQMERAKHVRKQLTTSKTWRADTANGRLVRETRQTTLLREALDKEKRLTVSLGEDLSRARQDNVKLQRDFDSVVRSKADLRAAVKHRTSRISTRVAKAAARNSSSIFAESLPYLGIPVVIAAASWDLKDACDTMKDLHELDSAFNPESVDTSDQAKVCGTKIPTKEEILGKVKDSPALVWNKTKELYDSAPDIPPPPSWSEVVSSGRSTWWKINEWASSLFN